MAKKEPLQHCSDPKKLWTAKEIGRYRQKDDPKRMDIREDTSGGSGRQQCFEGFKHKTALAA
jgi:hypothetical protein